MYFYLLFHTQILLIDFQLLSLLLPDYNNTKLIGDPSLLIIIFFHQSATVYLCFVCVCASFKDKRKVKFNFFAVKSKSRLSSFYYYLLLYFIIIMLFFCVLFLFYIFHKSEVTTDVCHTFVKRSAFYCERQKTPCELKVYHKLKVCFQFSLLFVKQTLAN